MPRKEIVPPVPTKPSKPPGLFNPVNSMMGVLAYPVAVVASMVTGALIVGSADNGAIVLTPALGISK